MKELLSDQIGLGAAFGRPKAVPSASGRVPETALGAQNGSRPIFRRFWVGLGWIFVEFRTIFRRFALEPRATKTQKQDLKKEPRDPQRTSWLLRCGRASYCSHIFPNFFRTLHDQFFFVAYPQAHLVHLKSNLYDLWGLFPDKKIIRKSCPTTNTFSRFFSHRRYLGGIITQMLC